MYLLRYLSSSKGWQRSRPLFSTQIWHFCTSRGFKKVSAKNKALFFRIFCSTHAWVAQSNRHLTYNPFIDGWWSSIPTGDNFSFCWNLLKHAMSILHRKFRNARFVLKPKTWYNWSLSADFKITLYICQIWYTSDFQKRSAKLAELLVAKPQMSLFRHDRLSYRVNKFDSPIKRRPKYGNLD